MTNNATTHNFKKLVHDFMYELHEICHSETSGEDKHVDVMVKLETMMEEIGKMKMTIEMLEEAGFESFIYKHLEEFLFLHDTANIYFNHCKLSEKELKKDHLYTHLGDHIKGSINNLKRLACFYCATEEDNEETECQNKKKTQVSKTQVSKKS